MHPRTTATATAATAATGTENGTAATAAAAHASSAVLLRVERLRHGAPRCARSAADERFDTPKATGANTRTAAR